MSCELMSRACRRRRWVDNALFPSLADYGVQGKVVMGKFAALRQKAINYPNFHSFICRRQTVE